MGMIRRRDRIFVEDLERVECNLKVHGGIWSEIEISAETGVITTCALSILTEVIILIQRNYIKYRNCIVGKIPSAPTLESELLVKVSRTASLLV